MKLFQHAFIVKKERGSIRLTIIITEGYLNIWKLDVTSRCHKQKRENDSVDEGNSLVARVNREEDERRICRMR